MIDHRAFLHPEQHNREATLAAHGRGNRFAPDGRTSRRKNAAAAAATHTCCYFNRETAKKTKKKTPQKLQKLNVASMSRTAGKPITLLTVWSAILCLRRLSGNQKLHTRRANRPANIWRLIVKPAVCVVFVFSRSLANVSRTHSRTTVRHFYSSCPGGEGELTSSNLPPTPFNNWYWTRCYNFYFIFSVNIDKYIKVKI